MPGANRHTMPAGLKNIVQPIKVLLIGLLLSLSAPASAAETITFIHTDVYNSPVAASDASGVVIWREDYQPYGQKIKKEPGAASQTVWYTGKPQDPDSGLVYMGARHYNPQLGRFVSVDPVSFQEGNIHSFNRYAYGNNNPYKYVDPDGETPVDIIFLAVDFYKFGSAVVSGEGVGEAAINLGISALGVASPIPGTGLAIKAGRAGQRTTAAAKRVKLSGKNPPINQNRQKLHTNGTEGKSQFKDGVDADNLVQDAWRNGTPKFNKNGKLIGKVKQYKDEIGTEGQTSVDVRFSRKDGIHGFPSNKKE